MYTTLTLICLQHCLHYALYSGAATIMCISNQRYVKTLEKNWNNSGCIKVADSHKSVNFKVSQNSDLIKHLKQWNLEYSFSCEKLNFSANIAIRNGKIN